MFNKLLCLILGHKWGISGRNCTVNFLTDEVIVNSFNWKCKHCGKVNNVKH